MQSNSDDLETLGLAPDFDDEIDADEEVGAAWQGFKAFAFSRRTAFIAATFIVAVIAFFYVVLPLLPGLRDSLRTVQEEADRTWLVAALVFEILSYGSYIYLFSLVYGREVPRLTLRRSYEIAMAGVAATRLLGAAGAGGIALTYWAVRRAGMTRRNSISHIVAFMVILYAVFAAALVIDGLLLHYEVIPGNNPFGVTVVPMFFGLFCFFVFFLILALPGNIERTAARWATGRGRLARIAGRLVQVPALIGEGARVAWRLLREDPQAVVAAVGWWAFDIAVLWCCFKAFGGTPPLGVVIMGYLVGMIANMLPVPGGVGAVEGGMIGTFAAFGVAIGPAAAAVLAYRLFAFFLPTLPGIVAYTRLLKVVGEWRAEDATIKSKVLTSNGQLEGQEA